MAICKICGEDKSLMRSGMCSSCMRAIPRSPHIKKSDKRKKSKKSDVGGSGLGSDRLTKTLDVLCGDDLPEKDEGLTTETTALLILVAAVILYYLFFHGRGGVAAPVNKYKTQV